MTAALQGIRVLVVEDEFLVATLIEDMLTTAGCVVLGPIPRLAEALDAVHRGTFDAAVLDVNLAGDRIDPVADLLWPCTPSAHAFPSRSRWRICSTRCRASSPLPARRRELDRRPPPPRTVRDEAGGAVKIRQGCCCRVAR
jgi:hypothetical protein